MYLAVYLFVMEIYNFTSYFFPKQFFKSIEIAILKQNHFLLCRYIELLSWLGGTSEHQNHTKLSKPLKMD